MEGWWCARHGDALAWVEAPTAAAALRRSLDLHPLGDWTDDAHALVAFPQDAYPDHSGPHDYTRAVLRADPPPGRRRARPHSGSPAAILGGLAAVLVLVLSLVPVAAAEAWRDLTVARDEVVEGPRSVQPPEFLPETANDGFGTEVMFEAAVCRDVPPF